MSLKNSLLKHFSIPIGYHRLFFSSFGQFHVNSTRLLGISLPQNAHASSAKLRCLTSLPTSISSSSNLATVRSPIITHLSRHITSTKRDAFFNSSYMICRVHSFTPFFSQRHPLSAPGLILPFRHQLSTSSANRSESKHENGKEQKILNNEKPNWRVRFWNWAKNFVMRYGWRYLVIYYTIYIFPLYLPTVAFLKWGDVPALMSHLHLPQRVQEWLNSVLSKPGSAWGIAVVILLPIKPIRIALSAWLTRIWVQRLVRNNQLAPVPSNEKLRAVTKDVVRDTISYHREAVRQRAHRRKQALITRLNSPLNPMKQGSKAKWHSSARTQGPFGRTLSNLRARRARFAERYNRITCSWKAYKNRWHESREEFHSARKALREKISHKKRSDSNS